jgi:hypothetical protein
MCQVILSERTNASPDVAALKNTIVNYNQTNRDLHKHHIDGLPVVEDEVPPIEGFFPRLDYIYYRLVETVGFDDKETDDANHKWFKDNSKWFDILIFVTDKEKCMNNDSEQKLFRKTVDDIKVCQLEGKTIPIVVVINKIDGANPDDLNTMANQCRTYVLRILAEAGIPDHPCTFCRVTAMKTLYYRLFMSSNSFQHMDQHSIEELAQLELGVREGKALSASNDEVAREYLRQRLLSSLKSSSVSWQKDCGVHNIIKAISPLLNESTLPSLLMGHLRARISEMEKVRMVTSDFVLFKDFLLDILRAYKSYQRVYSSIGREQLSEEESASLSEIKMRAVECFKQNCDRYKWSSNLELIDCIQALAAMRKFDEKHSLRYSLLSEDEWKDVVGSVLLQQLASRWGFTEIKAKDAPTPSKSTATATTLAASNSTSASNSQPSLRMVQQFGADAYMQAIDITAAILQEEVMKPYLDHAISKIVIPIIKQISTTMGPMKFPLQNKILLLYLEEQLIQVEIEDLKLRLNLYCEIIQKKIANRNDPAFRGYTTAFRELLHDHAVVRKRYLFEFYPISSLHSSEQSTDLDWKWVADVVKQNASDMENAYETYIENHPRLITEKLLIPLYYEYKRRAEENQMVVVDEAAPDETKPNKRRKKG